MAERGTKEVFTYLAVGLLCPEPGTAHLLLQLRLAQTRRQVSENDGPDDSSTRPSVLMPRSRGLGPYRQIRHHTVRRTVSFRPPARPKTSQGIEKAKCSTPVPATSRESEI